MYITHICSVFTVTDSKLHMQVLIFTNDIYLLPCSQLQVHRCITMNSKNIIMPSDCIKVKVSCLRFRVVLEKLQILQEIWIRT